MTTRRAFAFRVWQLSVTGLTVSAVVLVTAFAEPVVPGLELVFFGWFVGFLVGVELFAPRHVAPASWSWIRWVVLVALVVTGLILVRRVLAMFPLT